MTAPTRPVLRWHGGKWRLAPWILDHMPSHRVYVEPFGGGASVLLRKKRSITEVYNDLDGSVVNFFQVCRDQARELARRCALTPYARAEYLGLYESTDDPVEAARMLVCRSFMGQNSKGVFVPSGFDGRMNDDQYTSRIGALVELPETILLVAARLRGVMIEHCPAIALMERYDTPTTLHYVDPPYLPEARGRNETEGRRRVYTHDLKRADHEKLLEFLPALQGMVMLSGYPSKLYESALRSWTRVETEARADGDNQRTEVLWLNPACAAALEAEAMPLFKEVS